MDDSGGSLPLLLLTAFPLEGEVAAAVAVVLGFANDDGFRAGVAVELILAEWWQGYMER